MLDTRIAAGGKGQAGHPSVPPAQLPQRHTPALAAGSIQSSLALAGSGSPSRRRLSGSWAREDQQGSGACEQGLG